MIKEDKNNDDIDRDEIVEMKTQMKEGQCVTVSAKLPLVTL